MLNSELLNRITVNPKVMVGKPVIRGLRITVEQILKALANGVTPQDLLDEPNNNLIRLFVKFDAIRSIRLL